MDIIDLANFLQTHWLPLLAGLVNFVWVYLEYKASIWLWPVGIVLPILYIAVSWDALYIGNIVINIYYLITSIIGWIMWLRKRDNEEEAPIRHAHPRELVLALLGILILSVPAYYLLDGNSSMPSLDAVATVTSFIGMKSPSTGSAGLSPIASAQLSSSMLKTLSPLSSSSLI